MDLIQKACIRYKDKFNVTIRVVDDRGGKAIVKVSQDKTIDGNYFSANELRDIVKSLFSSVYDEFHVGPIPYEPLAHDIVNERWLKVRLAANAMKIKTLARNLGMLKATVTNHLSGNKSMNNEESAMYYYYFKSLEHKSDEEE